MSYNVSFKLLPSNGLTNDEMSDEEISERLASIDITDVAYLNRDFRCELAC
jgi:hypothetical protein